ncbi:putative tail protein [Vibrio phage BONAISHI]|nr:putative tail protein [Vibrio phage BONAISHI]
MSTLYPFDQTGFNPANKITNEEHVINTINGSDHNYIVPKNAPFFKESISIIDTATGEFLEDDEFECTHHFSAGDDALARKVYGSITLLDANRTGTFKIEYQTLGGDFVTNLTQVIANGMATLAALRTADWADLVGVPPEFPVTAHTQPVTDILGVQQFLDVMNQIEEGVVDPNNSFTLDDVTDLNTVFITPLLTVLNDIKASIQARDTAVTLPVVRTDSGKDDSDLGAQVAGTWFDTGLSVVIPSNGTYLTSWSHPSTVIDEDLKTQWRFMVDDVEIDDGYKNNSARALAQGQVVKLQARVLSGNSSNFYLSRYKTPTILQCLRIGL